LDIFEEGKTKKGGVNDSPSRAKPKFNPPPARPKNKHIWDKENALHLISDKCEEDVWRVKCKVCGETILVDDLKDLDDLSEFYLRQIKSCVDDPAARSMYMVFNELKKYKK
jgi:hypothetical protein